MHPRSTWRPVASTFDLDQQSAETAEQSAEPAEQSIGQSVEQSAGPTAGPVDGRTARAVRTRGSIVDATLELLAEGDVRPSAPRIAERASVSVRSVFQHFDDLETLYAAVGDRVVEQVVPLIHHIDAARPLDERILEFIHQRAQVNELLTPTLRAAVVHAPGSPTINNQFQTGHDVIGLHVAQVFGPELELAPDRQLLFDSLISIGSWSLWNTLRSLNRLSLVDAERVVLHMAACTLGQVVGRDITALVDRVIRSENHASNGPARP